MSKWRDSCHPYAMITIFFWSLAYVLTRIALRHYSALPLGFLRYFIASCTLLPFVFLTGVTPPKKEDRKWFLASGAAGFFLYMIFFNTGCETAAASTSSVVIATVPVMTALLARLILGERLSRFQWTAVFIEFGGVLLMTLSKGGFIFDKGILWLILAAVSLSAYNLLQRRLTKTYTALQSAAFSIFAGTMMLIVFFPPAAAELRSAPLPMTAAVAVMGVFSSAVAYAAWSKAFSKAERTSSVSNYMFVTPFAATLLGFVLAGEKPDLSTVAGGIVILSGMAVFYYGEKVRQAVRHKKNGENCRK